MARAPKAALCTDWTGEMSLLFFIACGLTKETHTIATKETEKNGHQKSSSVPMDLALQSSTAAALPHAHNHLLRSLAQSVPPFLCFSPPNATFFLSQPNNPLFYSLSRHFAPSEPIQRQSLMH